MDSKRTWLLTVGTALAAILSALATHGKGAVTALAGIPVMLQAWASGLPLGIWSFVLSLVLATLVWAAAIVKLPVRRDGHTPHFTADTLALIVALTVTMSQSGVGGGKLLSAFWVGLLAGLLAPYIGKAIRAVVASRKPKE